MVKRETSNRILGYKPGTNIHYRPGPSPAERYSAMIAAAAGQDAACAEGRHDETVAKPRYVTYVAGQQVPPGTRYCRRCRQILPAPGEPL